MNKLFTAKVRIEFINSFRRVTTTDIDLIDKYSDFILQNDLLQTERDLHELVWLTTLRGEDIVKRLRYNGVKPKYFIPSIITP